MSILIYIYIYITGAFEVPTFLHISIILKKKKLFLTQKFQLKNKAIVKIKPDTQKRHSPSPLSSLFLYPSPPPNAIIYISFLKI